MTAQTVSLRLGERPVAEYAWQPRLPETVSPRPFLHPVRTLGGTEVTESMPADHLHHLGVSVAVADVGGANFWGGRTFVPGRGPVHLPNHGTQRHHRWTTRDASSVHHELRWIGPAGTDLVRERRRIAALPVNDRAWALDFGFELTNVTGEPLAFASPATNGRPGAGYGGFFWRARRGDRRIHVLGPDRTGERRLHGQRTAWLALSGADTDPWTLIFVPGQADLWFVRSRDYAGVGSALAWDQPLVVGSGSALRRRIITVVADGRLRSREVAGIAGEVAALHDGWPP
ncbi:PmoA family protein [Phytohabitans sp. ZYX-F-186]|uniref:PmoA family protein n=1 Tax=Phytohabitans maris TaxID=3071409 RepID=A0ABU0ZEB8_9ACTN|nr:PmoA family protein [Phytohabitans sp. ZYX-F-186]MDQ7905400.1 PmoA family protein [Phytohabitans sp. ZYX-F-186]